MPHSQRLIALMIAVLLVGVSAERLAALVPGIWFGSDENNVSLAILPSVDEKVDLALRCKSGKYDIMLSLKDQRIRSSIGQNHKLKWTLNGKVPLEIYAQITAENILVIDIDRNHADTTTNLITMKNLRVTFLSVDGAPSFEFQPNWSNENNQYHASRVLTRCRLI